MTDAKEFPCALCNRDLTEPAELFECRNEHVAELGSLRSDLAAAREQSMDLVGASADLLYHLDHFLAKHKTSIEGDHGARLLMDRARLLAALRTPAPAPAQDTAKLGPAFYDWAKTVTVSEETVMAVPVDAPKPAHRTCASCRHYSEPCSCETLCNVGGKCAAVTPPRHAVPYSSCRDWKAKAPAPAPETALDKWLAKNGSEPAIDLEDVEFSPEFIKGLCGDEPGLDDERDDAPAPAQDPKPGEAACVCGHAKDLHPFNLGCKAGHDIVTFCTCKVYVEDPVQPAPRPPSTEDRGEGGERSGT